MNELVVSIGIYHDDFLVYELVTNWLMLEDKNSKIYELVKNCSHDKTILHKALEYQDSHLN